MMSNGKENLGIALDEDAYEADSEQEDEDKVSEALKDPFNSLTLSDKKEDKADEKKAILKRKVSKTRLILGDGNFSYSRSSLKKKNEQYPGFSSTVVVSEYSSEASLSTTYADKEDKEGFKNFEKNVAALREMGASIKFDVDARNIHGIFKDRHFRRIHFNFPYWNDKKLTPAQNKAKTRELVGGFFASASQAQKPGDRIHMGLATGYIKDPIWYEDATYGVAEFCERYGYVYIKKRDFIDPVKGKRHDGYFHVKTNSASHVETAETGREHIFEKRVPGKFYENSIEIRSTQFGKPRRVLKNRDTDSDSSSGVEHSDADEVAALDKSKSSKVNPIFSIVTDALSIALPEISSLSLKEKKASKKQDLLEKDHEADDDQNVKLEKKVTPLSKHNMHAEANRKIEEQFRKLLQNATDLVNELYPAGVVSHAATQARERLKQMGPINMKALQNWIVVMKKEATQKQSKVASI